MLLNHLKTSNAKVKAALSKTNMAEQEESSKNYKHAFELYKEAVELLMPVAEGIHVIVWLRTIQLTQFICTQL